MGPFASVTTPVTVCCAWAVISVPKVIKIAMQNFLYKILMLSVVYWLKKGFRYFVHIHVAND